MALGNGFDNPTFDGFGSHFARGPMTDGALRVRWRFTRQRHDLAPLLGTEGRRCPWTWRIVETFEHRTVVPCQPVAPPSSNGETARPQEARHLPRRVPISKVQNNLRTEAEVLGRFMRTDEGEKLWAFVLHKTHRRCFRTRHSRLP